MEVATSYRTERFQDTIRVHGPGVGLFDVPLADLYFTGNRDTEYPQRLGLTGAGSQSVEHGRANLREIIEAARCELRGGE